MCYLFSADIEPKVNNPYEDICLTPGCVHAAARILEKIDQDIDPCDDFYKFSCNQFVKDTSIPEDKTSVGSFTVVTDKLKEQLKSIITSPIKVNDIEPFKNIKKLYLACMNKTLIEQRGTKPLTDIHEQLGGWPVLMGNDWNESKWTWQQSVKDFNKYGYSTDYIFDFSIDIDLKNTTKRLVDIDQSALGLSREYLSKGLDNPIVQAYHSYQVDLAVLYGADRKTAEKEMKDVLEFEFALAEICLPKEKRRNVTALYNAMTIKAVQARYPYNNWLDYFNAILPNVSQVTDDEIINVSVLSFFDALGPLLEKTPKRTIANYVMWRMTVSSTSLLTEDLRRRRLQFSTALSGKQEQAPRWKECISVASGSLGAATGAMYVRKYFKHDSKAAALEMVESIREEFIKILESVSWMDEKTRSAALAKARNMTHHIGYPDELMDDEKLIDYYKTVSVDQDKYFESILNINKFGTYRSFKKLREPVNKTDWISHSGAAIVNAYYSPNKNSIGFPAGILQGQFFSADRPRYLNYGAIGVVIGHEITHGFDDKGRQFDLDGNLVDWWEEETKKAYLEKARCIIEQYGNYTEPNVKLNLNGINTQGENIADNGGVKEAYLAYQKFVAKNGSEKKLPGLKYTQNQLFWISTAQTWCSVHRPEAMKLAITVNVHSPGPFRVLGPLSNMKEFSKDFNCPIGSKMNPAHKCEVW
ncbi:neprilysin-2-like [Chironomus tepperi]|uniref:neprilysin-2-like n=1 Tax=Chironomus tepperi TaxID=113505 RepID=UPI00391F25D7